MIEKKSKNKIQDSKIGKIVLAVVIVLVAIGGGYFLGKNMVSPIERTVNIEKEKDITKDWKTFEDDSYGFSFKYPEDLKVVPIKSVNGALYVIARQGAGTDSEDISIAISGNRSISTKDPIYAIQTSIPFDKKNYLIFSTSTENENKGIFYNILATLEFGVK